MRKEVEDKKSLRRMDGVEEGARMRNGMKEERWKKEKRGDSENIKGGRERWREKEMNEDGKEGGKKKLNKGCQR